MTDLPTKLLVINQPIQFTPKAEAFSFQVDNTPLLIFRHDGQVIVSDKLTPDEVGKRVIEIIAKQWPALINRARDEGRDEVRKEFASFGYEIRDGKIYMIQRVPIIETED